MTLAPDIAPPLSLPDLDELEQRLRATVEDRLTSIDLRLTHRWPRPASVECRDLGDLLITDWDAPDLEGVRTPWMARRDSEAVMLFTAFAGEQIVETPAETVVLRPGDVLVMSTRVTGRMVVPESLTKRTVRIPLSALSPYDTGPGIPDCLLLAAGRNPLACLAHDYLAGVDRHIDRMSAVEIEGARNALLVLTAGMLRAARAPEIGQSDFLPHLRQQLEAWIVERLTSGAIRVEDIARAHNVAPRTVYRAFATTGDTVGSVVRAHRLAAARSDLVNTRLSIATIATRWGFCDASHLGREFRRELSMSPREYREAHGVV